MAGLQLHAHGLLKKAALHVMAACQGCIKQVVAGALISGLLMVCTCRHVSQVTLPVKHCNVLSKLSIGMIART
jgi:hypothetical protein